MVDRRIQSQLEEAERLVNEAQLRIVKQEAACAAQELRGNDSTRARGLLAEMYKTLVLFQGHRNQIAAEIMREQSAS
jgi:ribosomal protein L22